MQVSAPAAVATLSGALAEAHMPDNLESLCDLVESRAAKEHVPLAWLWERVFVAIRDGKLDFGFPDEFEIEYGGRNPPPHHVSHIRKTMCVNALFAIKNGDAFPPWGQLWVRRMLVSSAAFDRALPPAPSKPEPPPEPPRGSRGPKKGTVGYGLADRALFPEMEKLIPRLGSATAAARHLVLEGIVAGRSTDEDNKTRRLAKAFLADRRKTR